MQAPLIVTPPRTSNAKTRKVGKKERLLPGLSPPPKAPQPPVASLEKTTHRLRKAADVAENVSFPWGVSLEPGSVNPDEQPHQGHLQNEERSGRSGKREFSPGGQPGAGFYEPGRAASQRPPTD